MKADKIYGLVTMRSRGVIFMKDACTDCTLSPSAAWTRDRSYERHMQEESQMKA